MSSPCEASRRSAYYIRSTFLIFGALCHPDVGTALTPYHSRSSLSNGSFLDTSTTLNAASAAPALSSRSSFIRSALHGDDNRRGSACGIRDQSGREFTQRPTLSSSSSFSSSYSAASTSALFARRSRRHFADDDQGIGDGFRAMERSVDRPVQTLSAMYGPSVQPAKPKIVVLGATGRVGRLVVKQLMNMQADITVVAVVRDEDKAIEVFFDDNPDYEEGVDVKGEGGGVAFVKRNDGRSKGPKLQIVVGNLVPREEVAGYVDEVDTVMLKNAKSASDFFGNDVEEYDFRHEHRLHDNEVLEECIKDCSAIISCVGTVRKTKVWTDLLARPFWRILRKDVSGWCRDASHPYYVNYASTKKVLGMAEREQRRREAIIEAEEEAMEKEAIELGYRYPKDEEEKKKKRKIDRIKFVRISDLCVTHKAWDFVPVVTNTLQSLVFRYQDMAELELEKSKVIDTVILRPGDLVDEERNVTTTSLQVDASGSVPTPARVGRADVAALAVATALTKIDGTCIVKDQHNNHKFIEGMSRRNEASQERKGPVHLTLGVRWAGEHMDPYPPQGTKNDGLPDAQTCMNKIINLENRKAKRRRRREMQLDFITKSLSDMTRPLRRRRVKPYGIFVAVPVYLFFAVILYCGAPMLKSAPGRELVGAFIMRYMPLMQKHFARMPKRGVPSYVSF